MLLLCLDLNGLWFWGVLLLLRLHLTMEGVASVYFVVSDNDFGPRPKFVQFEASETLSESLSHSLLIVYF